MKYNPYSYALSVLCILCLQNFVRTENDEFMLCDYTHMEHQVETLKTSHDFLNIRVEVLKVQLDRQNELLNNLERKINDLPREIQTMQYKLSSENKLNFEDLKDFLHKQIQNPIATAVAPVDDKLFILADIKKILKDYDTILDDVVKNQNKTQQLLREANWERHTQTLETNISNKLRTLEKIDTKVIDIANGLVTKAEQLQFYRDVQQHIHKDDAARICYKSEHNDLICTLQSYPSSCADFNESHCADNKCRIRNHLYGPRSFLVACNDREENGGWTVIQRRINGSVDFYRNWSEYKNGFGNVDGELFIGMDKLHALTATLRPMELLIQMEDFNNTMKYAKYDDFQVGNETENYKLIKVGSYSGTAGDAFSFHEGQKFSTKDRDNDEDNTANCAINKTGAWWYKSCMWSNLNGKYYSNGAAIPKGERGICWSEFHGYNYSMKFVQMMIRPKRL